MKRVDCAELNISITATGAGVARLMSILSIGQNLMILKLHMVGNNNICCQSGYNI